MLFDENLIAVNQPVGTSPSCGRRDLHAHRRGGLDDLLGSGEDSRVGRAPADGALSGMAVDGHVV